MVYDVFLTKRFRRKFDRILDLYINEYGYPNSALDLEQRLAEISGTLAIFPELYPVYKNTHLNGRGGSRFITVREYVFFYSVDEKRKVVIFEDIINGKLLK